jgi:hypothetical protein
MYIFRLPQVRNGMKYEEQQSHGGSGTDGTATDVAVVVTK